MSTDSNKELVSRFYREVINEQNLEAIARLLSDDFTHNGERRGRDGQRQAVEAFLRGFPDLENEILLLVGEGDLVAAHQRWRGTHRGDFLGVPATGKEVSFTSTAVLRIRDDEIAEAWDEVDLLGLLTQLRRST